jgi:hypothetical protein
VSVWLLCTALAAQAEPRPLHEFSVDAQGLTAATAGGVRLGVAEQAALPEVGRRLNLEAGPNRTFTVRWPVPQPKDAPTPGHTAATFFVDFDEPPVAALVAHIKGIHGARPPVQTLVAMVDEHIKEKNGSRGMDVASVVARRREGDCTEHAVLLTAVARAFGWPARVVNGLAVVALRNGSVGVFGHAWTEVFEGGTWRVADAALRRQNGTVHHIPMAVIVQEGMGFKAAVMQQADVTDVRSVTLVR